MVDFQQELTEDIIRLMKEARSQRESIVWFPLSKGV